MKKLFLFTFLSLAFFTLHSQSLVVKGTVKDAQTKKPISGVEVDCRVATALSGENGYFGIRFRQDSALTEIVFSHPDYLAFRKKVNLSGESVLDLGEVMLSKKQESGEERNQLLTEDNATNEDRIPIITLDNDELEGNDFDENLSGVLSASQDVFLASTAYNLSTARFRIRGYDSENMMTYMNGIPINELESGRVFWSQWGGLNDVTRNRETDLGLVASAYGFGGVTGITAFDTRASNQRVQKRFSYYTANRSYRHRLMGTWSTGMLPSGWAVSLSGSRRWAEEGYLPGTFYDAWSYFASIDRKLGEKHIINLTAFGAPVERGRPGSSVREVYDLVNEKVGDEKSYFDFFDVKEGNFYNPYWGWQNGKKRNSRVNKAHQPMFILRHDWEMAENQTLTTAASYQFGRYGNTRLDWFDAPDPRPDYYRNLPSYFALESPEAAEQVRDMFLNNPELFQVDFDKMIEANRNNPYGFQDNVGQWSQYIIEEQRYDSKEFNFNMNYEGVLSDVLTLNAGLSYQQYDGHNYKTVSDLLGGDYYVNIDKFVDNDEPAEAAQYDLNDPDRIVREGDVWGYDYEPKIQKAGLWAQGQFSYSEADVFIAGEISQSKFWRKGNFRNGRFLDNSFGDSEKTDFFNFGIKGGVTYKFSNQYYLYGNLSYRTRAPFSRNSFLSPRTRHDLIPDLKNEKIGSAEAGFVMNAPWMKARATFYYTRFDDQTDVIQFFVRGNVTNFGSYVLSGVDKTHSGVELAAEAKINSALRISGVAALGQYLFTSRPEGLLVFDSDNLVRSRGTVFIKDFYVPGTPQTALSGSINYNGKFWFAEITTNYFNNFYVDFSPERRIADATYGLSDSDLYHQIVDQTKAPDAFTVDLFGGKSFRIGSGKYLYLTVGVTNLLNNTNVVAGGYEQLSFSRVPWEENGTNLFPPRLYYAYGTNFFAMVSVRL